MLLVGMFNGYMVELNFHPIMGSYAMVLVAGLVLLLLLVIGPAFRPVSRRQRAVLIGLRMLVILLVVIAMLRPTLITTSDQQQTATLIVMLDVSRSLQVPDMPGGKTRWQAQRELFQEVVPILRELSDKYEVKLYTFDREARPLDFQDGQIGLPESPEGLLTDIGSSLDDVVRREGGKRLAAVFLLSDGAQRIYSPRVEIHEAARQLAAQRTPLYTVPFGQDIEKSQARDVAVENLPDHFTVFVKNELAVRGLLRVRGFVNQPLPVELVITNSQGEERVVQSRKLMASEDGQQLDIELTYIPQKPGQYRLTLRAAEQPGELVTNNNQLSAFVTVLEGGLKVLYLYGELQPEQKYLRWALDAASDIQLDHKWIDHRRRDQWPVDLEDLLGDTKYDVFLLGDLDSRALGNQNLQAINEAVARGKGLVMIGGLHSFGPGGYHGGPLADVLPIQMDRLEKQDFAAPLREDLHHPGPLPMLPAPAVSHFITHLASGQENLVIWRRLAPLRGANKFAGLKPTAQVLAQTPDGTALLVADQYGLGRVLAFAGDSTWQWWLQGQRDQHKRFWRQVVLWLARKDHLARKNVWVQLPQRRYNPDSQVTFTAGAKSADGDAIEGAVLTAEVVLPDGKLGKLHLSEDGEHWTGLLDSASQTGLYTIQINATQNEAPLGTAQAKFLVVDQDIELGDPSAHPDQLDTLSEITQQAGGRRLQPEQLAPLLKKIANSPPEMDVQVQSRWQLGDTAPDAWLFFLCLVGLLGGEWFLRKKWGLV